MSSTKTDTRTAILDAARSMFESQGYFAVGLEAVAKKAGVSRQAVYLHFESKAELLRALHDRVFELDVSPVMQRHGVWEASTALEALDAFVRASGEVIPKIKGISRALGAVRRVDPDVEESLQAPGQGRQRDCLRLAKWLKRDGALARGVRVADAGDILWCLLSIHAYESLVVERSWSPQRWERWVRRLLRRELLDEVDPGSRTRS